MAFVLRHALRIELEPQMRGTCLLFFLLKPDYHIGAYWLRDTFELVLAVGPQGGMPRELYHMPRSRHAHPMRPVKGTPSVQASRG